MEERLVRFGHICIVYPVVCMYAWKPPPHLKGKIFLMIYRGASDVAFTVLTSLIVKLLLERAIGPFLELKEHTREFSQLFNEFMLLIGFMGLSTAAMIIHVSYFLN